MAKRIDKIMKERIEEFSDPKKAAELWKRTQAALGDTLDGGVKLLDGLLVSLRDNGLSASKDGYRALQDARNHLSKLRSALRNGRLDARRFDESYLQIRETLDTRFKAIKEKQLRELATSWEKAVDAGVEMLMQLPRKIFG